jgi:outer membrane lipoprotein-sorting protein
MGLRRAAAACWLLASVVTAPAVPQEDAAVRPAAPQGDAAIRPAADDFLQRVRAAILQSQPFRVDFVQQVFVDEEMTLKESGVVVFADREHVKWQYLDPEFKVFILEKDRYRFYDRETNQLLRGRLGERDRQLVWDLLLSDQPGGSASWDAARRTIRLRLDDGSGADGPRELKIFVGADLLPQRLEQAAENGVTTVYVFRNYRRRVALPAGEFDLDLPADVEVIEEQGP